MTTVQVIHLKSPSLSVFASINGYVSGVCLIWSPFLSCTWLCAWGVVPDFAGQQPGVVVPAVPTEAGQDGQVVVFLLVADRQEAQLTGQDVQPLPQAEQPHRQQLRKEAQVHPVLAGVVYLCETK